MSELIQKNDNRATIRWKLLTSASALALTAAVTSASIARAEDADHPQIWIELGGQFEQQTEQGDVFSPSFAAGTAFQPGVLARLERAPLFTSGPEAKLTFEPSGSDWVFSAAVQFGRANGRRSFEQNHHMSHVFHTTQRLGHVHYTAHGSAYLTHYIEQFTRTPQLTQVAGGQVAQRQTHAIVDFTAGKDVGLGMFGSGSTSSFNVGLRIAQFVSKASGAINTNDPKFITGYNEFLKSRFPSYAWRKAGSGKHLDHATFESQHEFHGIGPSVSWNASLPIAGEEPAGTLKVDWGVNAALLFGRQRALSNHHTSVYYRVVSATPVPHTQHTSAGGFNRSRAVIVPNAGGFAGLSFNFTNAKVALGYRADFFFGAMDTGQDTRKTKTVGFYGPFATISIGIGG
jgi:iron complex outermembrane receptor protein